MKESGRSPDSYRKGPNDQTWEIIRKAKPVLNNNKKSRRLVLIQANRHARQEPVLHPYGVPMAQSIPQCPFR